MKTCLITCFIMLCLSCTNKTISRWENGNLKEIQFYKKKKLVKFMDYYENQTLQREVYYNRKPNVDSAFSYKENGTIRSSEYYDSAGLVKLSYYWPGGNCKTVYQIDKLDTLETPEDSMIVSEIIYTGHQTNFYENGQKQEEGRLF